MVDNQLDANVLPVRQVNELCGELFRNTVRLRSLLDECRKLAEKFQGVSVVCQAEISCLLSRKGAVLFVVVNGCCDVIFQVCTYPFPVVPWRHASWVCCY